MKKPKAYPKFQLGDTLTKEQMDFFNRYGFIHFAKVFSEQEIQNALAGYNKMVERIIREGKEVINGIPITFGFDENQKKMIHRMPFTSQHCEEVRMIAANPRLKPLLQLLPFPNARMVENEKDGVVFNHYINSKKSNYKQMGWHTDSARDIFYGKKISPMLNVGIYLDDSSEKNGGLRIIPGTHKQKILSMLFRKAYFVNNDADKNEVLVSAQRGDVVIHHGHMWHRVAPSPHTNEIVRRRVMYIPAICDKYQPKNDNSKTPFYHHLRSLGRMNKRTLKKV